MQGVQLETDLLKNIPLFRSLSDDLLQAIINAPENGIEEYEPKKLIIRESEIGDCMYIILEGRVEVLIRAESSNREISIANLRDGDFFGERSLMPGSTGRRNASIKSLFKTRVFRIDRKYIELSVKRDDFNLEEDEDVTAINLTKSESTRVVTPKDKGFQPDEARDLLMSMRLFKSLNREEFMSINDWTEIVKVGPGDFVMKEAQPGEAMFVVLDGTVEIFTLDNDGKIVILAHLAKGDYFGEQSLMPDSKGKRNAFARSDKEAKLIKVPKEYFRLVLNRDSALAKELQQKHEANKQALKNVRQP